ncbi:MAG: type III pantothenate kinase, partial [Thermodesulfobacteriota bacterium]
MLLVIDIGNTNTVLGLFDDQRLVCDWRIRTERNTTEDELQVLVSGLFAASGVAFSGITRTVIASVVPPVERIYDAFCRKYLGGPPRWVNAAFCAGITIRYANPQEVGADRIVNAVGAHAKYKTDMIVVDFGTATTFDLVAADGAYEGGVIAPGIGISAEALFSHASKLPRVDLRTVPETVVGKDTAGSIKSGIIFGYAGLVDGIVDRMIAERGRPHKVIATGGLAPLMAGVSRTIEAVEP